MKVEIWSDVMCPFCYLGKHRFEKALAQFPYKEAVEIEWKSFQLDPALNGITPIETYFAKKGMPANQVAAIQANMKAMAEGEGIAINIEKTIISNTYKAHQLIQLAKTLGTGLQNNVEETLFEMYFKEGRDMEQDATIMDAAERLHIDADLVKEILEKDTQRAAFEKDIAESQQLGIRGVPFFVLDRKYAVSGAQSPEHFLAALTQAYDEWSTKQPLQQVSFEDGATCDSNGNCE